MVVGTGMLAARITGTARRGVSLEGLGAVLEQRVGLLRGPSTLLARQGLLLLERGHGGSGEAWPQMFGYEWLPRTAGTGRGCKWIDFAGSLWAVCGF